MNDTTPHPVSGRGQGRWVVLGPALASFAAGIAIFLAAVGWSVWVALRGRA